VNAILLTDLMPVKAGSSAENYGEIVLEKSREAA